MLYIILHIVLHIVNSVHIIMQILFFGGRAPAIDITLSTSITTTVYPITAMQADSLLLLNVQVPVAPTRTSESGPSLEDTAEAWWSKSKTWWTWWTCMLGKYIHEMCNMQNMFVCSQ